MLLAALAVLVGLALLIWSADRFVEGASALARLMGMAPLLVGIVIVGFGTSAPEMVVSALAALQGSPGIALGNAYGSNIANIALILGATALMAPVVLHRSVLRKELPLLAGATLFAAALLLDGDVSRLDAIGLLLLFAAIMGHTIWSEAKRSKIQRAAAHENDEAPTMSPGRAAMWLAVGLGALVGSSRLLVWGAVEIANSLGVSDVVVGLTVVAIGTSLPELASSIVAAKKGQHDIALGNVLGSNLFNTLAVVGIAGAISPMTVDSMVLYRDVSVMGALTISLFVFGFAAAKGKPGRINRIEGAVLIGLYAAYTGYLVITAVG